ncbi:hypothetical protein EUX98_g7118 [Antrodiella citrinella]|uniref:Uncharacterized protein n=1 Tax=Antrodiella citrinella TaxID=2447956 RepID=A0A4S4MUQ2_9APHY|nr:hypothetical protein EUX98_g7118 [Antrodiella citrinella]
MGFLVPARREIDLGTYLDITVGELLKRQSRTWTSNSPARHLKNVAPPSEATVNLGPPLCG